MSRTVDDAPITTRAARDRLEERHSAYWRGIGAGAALGYRKGKRGGVWLARVADAQAGGGYRQQSLGAADDTLKADAVKVLDYRQAEAKAREWIAQRNRITAGLEAEPDAKPAAPVTVAEVMAAYLTEQEAKGKKGVVLARGAVKAHILPELGSLTIARLTRERIRAWHRAIAATPPRRRSKAGAPVRYRDTSNDPDAPRRRRSTANRILTILKAALNFARVEGLITGPADAWSAVQAHREADAARVRYLLDAELPRLVKACPPDFRALVKAALLTGCRYGELAAMRVADFDPQAGTVTVEQSKSGRPRHVALTHEGRTFFAQMAADKPGTARLFERDAMTQQATRTAPAVMSRARWGNSDQFRFMRAACEAAKIVPPVSFHVLRHTYGSRAAQRGVGMAVIAAQLGHADTRMTEKHYAHLSPSYVANTVRQLLGTMGILGETAGAD